VPLTELEADIAMNANRFSPIASWRRTLPELGRTISAKAERNPCRRNTRSSLS